MQDPGVLTAAIISKMQSIAPLVVALGGDPTKIFPYRRISPAQLTIQAAVWRIPIPGIMVAWEGTAPGNMGKMEKWKHRFGLYVRPAETVKADASYGAYLIWKEIINGVPKGNGADGLKFLLTSIDPSCYPMDPPSITPQSGQVDESAGVFEYWKVSLSLSEKGDY